MVRTNRFAPLTAQDVSAWDGEADVVVVGSGAAGTSAAIGAAEAGAQVLVLERSSAPGGASAMSGGILYLGGGTPLQTACGIYDTAEEMFSFLMAACGPHADEAKVRAYCDGSVAHFNWLVECGVPFKPEFEQERHALLPDHDAGLMWVGENSHPFDQLANPVPRGHRPATPGEGGWLLMERLAARAKELGVRSRADTTIEHLVVDDEGAVVGVHGRSADEEVAVRARRGVVLAGGGFGFNDAMLSQFAPQLLGHGKLGSDTDDGLTIQLGRGAGAAVRRMDAGSASIMVPPELLLPSMLVNSVGQRFINEDTYFGRIGQHALFHQAAETYLVLDGATYDSVPSDKRLGIRPTWVCGSVEELEAEMHLPIGALQDSVAFYNRNAALGHDPLFRKNPAWLRPLEAPFGAADLRPRPRGDGTLRSRYWIFTLGGLDTDVSTAVLDLTGEPIPALYAAGRCTSSIQAWGYISGTSLGDSTLFGRRAGAAAAERASH